ncbi:MAG: YdcF family protein [Acidimicrobiales bacterium]
MRPARGSKRRRKTAPRRRPGRWIAATALFVVGTYILITFAQVWLASQATEVPATDPDVTAAVVLGAAQYNGEPSPVLRARLDRAAELYTEGRVGLVVVTGGRQPSDATTEAKTGYDYLRTAGVPDEDLRLEVQGASTYESLAATARFLPDEGVTEVVLVTDAYHARRASLVAEEVGLNPEVWLTDGSPTFGRLVHETVAVGVGRIITFRRLDLL